MEDYLKELGDKLDKLTAEELTKLAGILKHGLQSKVGLTTNGDPVSPPTGPPPTPGQGQG